MLLLAATATAFAPAPLVARRAAGLSTVAARRGLTLRGGAGATMKDITPNVSFDTIAREWRCKWSADNDKASLVKAQDALSEVIKEVRANNLFDGSVSLLDSEPFSSGEEREGREGCTEGCVRRVPGLQGGDFAGRRLLRQVG